MAQSGISQQRKKFSETSEGLRLDHSYFQNFFVGPLLHASKLWVGGGLQDFSVSLPNTWAG